LGITAVTQPNINAGVIENLLLPIPALSVQREILNRIEATFARIDRLAEEATSARRLVDRLDQAVLAKAFRGELVPQDPNDEPASVLLEWIRAERAAATAPNVRARGARGRRLPGRPTP
jgi:type I restriction enzyme S subunit